MVEDMEVSQQPTWMTQEEYATQQDSQGADFLASGEDGQGGYSQAFADAPKDGEVSLPCHDTDTSSQGVVCPRGGGRFGG